MANTNILVQTGALALVRGTVRPIVPGIYPIMSFQPGSSVLPQANTEIDRAVDGTIRGRRMFTSENYDVMLVHDFVDESVVDTVEDFYEANPINQINVIWRSVSYLCYWAKKPSVEPAGGITWRVTSALVGRRSDGL